MSIEDIEKEIRLLPSQEHGNLKTEACRLWDNTDAIIQYPDYPKDSIGVSVSTRFSTPQWRTAEQEMQRNANSQNALNLVRAMQEELQNRGYEIHKPLHVLEYGGGEGSHFGFDVVLKDKSKIPGLRTDLREAYDVALAPSSQSKLDRLLREGKQSALQSRN